MLIFQKLDKYFTSTTKQIFVCKTDIQPFKLQQSNIIIKKEKKKTLREY